MSAANREYVLGQSPQEYRRLARQAELLEPMTRRVLEDAGIRPGMRVLDLGAGAGDVSMLLAERVGATGRVIGLDQQADAVRLAEERASAAGFSNITFVHSELSQYVPEAPLDAIVGRLVLMYQAEPVAALASLAKHLRPGGVVAFLESWIVPPQGPESTTRSVLACIVETLRRSGAHLDLGPRLHKVFTSAGLPLPRMRFEAVMDGREDSPLYSYLADMYSSLLPKAIEYGLATADEVDVETLPERLRTEMSAAGYAVVVAPMVAAWCRTAEA